MTELRWILNAETYITAPVVAQVEKLSMPIYMEEEIVMCFGVVAGSDIVDRDTEMKGDMVVYRAHGSRTPTFGIYHPHFR